MTRCRLNFMILNRYMSNRYANLGGKVVYNLYYTAYQCDRRKIIRSTSGDFIGGLTPTTPSSFFHTRVTLKYNLGHFTRATFRRCTPLTKPKST